MVCTIPHYGNRGALPLHALDINVSRETLQSLTVRNVSRETLRLTDTFQEDARGTAGDLSLSKHCQPQPEVQPLLQGYPSRRQYST